MVPGVEARRVGCGRAVVICHAISCGGVVVLGSGCVWRGWLCAWNAWKRAQELPEGARRLRADEL